MLGSRTKQINSYGKRSQRIVNASQSESGGKSSIFDDLAPTSFGPVASKMKKKSESNVVAKSTSPKQRPVYKKKQSPIAQPLRQKLMRAQVARKNSNPAVEATPTRQPLAVYPLNTPGSPAIPSSLVQRRVKASAVTRTPLVKPHCDVVEVDIIILDDQGKTISRERRVSKGRSSSGSSVLESPDIVTPGRKPRVLRKKLPINVDELSESDTEHPSVDDSSHDDAPSQAIIPISKPEPSVRPHAPVKPPSRYIAHVLVPPPSPQLAAILKKAEPPSPPLSPLVDYDLAYVVKPRPLTPIRQKSRSLFRPPSPPSPLSDSDLDISMDFSGMNLGLKASDSDTTSLQAAPPVVPEYLRPLLEECQQDRTGLHEFSAFIETFAFDPVVRGVLSTKDLRFKKVGEASYSEVFGIGDVVLKVIPLRDESGASLSGSQKARSSDCADVPAPSDAKDVLKEIIVTRAMGEVCERFVKLVKAYVVRGRYPEVLLELWDQYAQANGSESVRPGEYHESTAFSVSQAYAIIVLPNGGPDLEAMRWRQACSIFWQVAKGLARAEQLVSFEHRDLHWGQILIKDLRVPIARPMQQQSLNTPARSHPVKPLMDDPCQGIQVTLIDLGLARMDAGDGQGGEMVHFTPFDEEILAGSGDYQSIIRASWEAFNPLTNVIWLHYLLTKLLKSKKATRTHTLSSSFTERECYECLLDLERWLSQCTAPILAKMKMKKTTSRKRSVLAPSPNPDAPVCAGEIVEYGIKKRWVKALSNL
ncbi:hypothetical protein BT96DRAFT_962040 [Gymnopus androsaceus JB14]|uniref:non-specific serine/threonine protein kinase n=1 Tax=Gymnopus androsaceus JB14 TaxID=1447944 RepID=A0A6A4ICR7_9AGAR|nr:hypothetical protein BT96DRAFT_962040 [Gymnopus androsaceus JB14]